MGKIWIVLLLCTPLIALLYFRLAQYKNRMSAEIVPSAAIPKGFFERNWLGFAASITCLICAWALLCTAMLVPGSAAVTPEPGRAGSIRGGVHGSVYGIDELLFLLDTSASMNAQDTSTGESRLDRAKEIIETILDNLGGINVRLIAFGNDAVAIVPPTEDYLYFRILLDSLGVNEYTEAGTSFLALADCVNKIQERDRFKESRMTLLLTDGEDTGFLDLSGQEKQDAIHALVSKISNAMHWDVVGLGSENGALVPGVLYDGKPVISKMHKEFLQEVSRRGGGRFYEESAVSLLSLVDNVLADSAVIGKKESLAFQPQSQQTINYIPVLAAFFLLLSMLMLPQGKVKV